MKRRVKIWGATLGVALAHGAGDSALTGNHEEQLLSHESLEALLPLGYVITAVALVALFVYTLWGGKQLPGRKQLPASRASFCQRLRC